jgi:hypothetical protein
MDPKSHVIAPGERSRNQVLFHDLTLVKCREPKIHDKQVLPALKDLTPVWRRNIILRFGARETQKRAASLASLLLRPLQVGFSSRRS